MPPNNRKAKLFKNGHDYEIITYNEPKRILNAKGFKLLGVKFHCIQCKKTPKSHTRNTNANKSRTNGS